MKLLKITAKGLDLFKEEVSIDFFASQQVREIDTDSVNKLFSNIYTNNAISFVGVNASGKTSTLKLILFVLELLNAEPINRFKYVDILENSENIEFEIYFYDDVEYLYKLYTEVTLDSKVPGNKDYVISKEIMWRKKSIKSMLKKSLLEFEGNPYMVRDCSSKFLKTDISIVISVSKNYNLYYDELIRQTEMTILGMFRDYPIEIVRFLDPSIENIHFAQDGDVYLKFYNKKEIHLNNIQLLHKYLSSGTIKGLNIFIRAMISFKYGGYLIVDELENHFNIEIVATLMRLFMDEQYNKNGATLIFSTHYPELLDEFDRNDSIYIIRNENGIYLEKLSEKLKRNDVKKSEVFKSDYLGGTAPTYSSYIALKRALKSSLFNNGGN